MKSRYAIALALAVASAAAAVTQAQANQYGANLTIRSAPGGDQFCMDAAGNRKEPGTPVFLWRCHGQENQRWTLSRNGDGSSAVVGTGGLCLDVRGNGASDGTPVQLWPCHFGPNQRFRALDDGRIQEVATGKCLMVLPEYDDMRDGGRERHREREMERDRDPGRDRERAFTPEAEQRRAWERWHARDFDRIRFSERDSAPIVIDDCEPRALQFWHLRP
jgi:Ricin-type beta-trefoil lectin domain